MVRRCVWSSLIAKVSITTGYYCNNMPPPSSFESSSTVSERSGAPLTASCRKTLFCIRTEAFKQLYPQRLSQWLNAEPNRGRGQYNLRFLRPYSFLDPTRARFEAAARDLSTVRVRYREPKTAIPKEPSDYAEFVDKWTYDGTSWMMQPVEESDAPNIPESYLFVSSAAPGDAPCHDALCSSVDENECCCHSLESADDQDAPQSDQMVAGQASD